MPYTREQLEQALYTAADSYGIDREIAWRQIKQESGFDPNAVGPPTRYGTAKGIAQFIDSTARDYGLTNPFDPIASLEAYGKYMRALLRMFGGDYAKAVGGYNWGPGNVQKAAAQYGSNWLAHAPAETRNYVAVIVGASGPAPAPSTAPGTDPTPDSDGGSGAGGSDNQWGDDDSDEPQTNWSLIIAVGAISLIALIALDD